MNEFVGYIDDQGRVFDGTFDYEGHVGPIGPQGEPGYTPQRGVDYWTDEDKAYVVAEATSLINGKIEEYNQNATDKTNAFNQNASDKTDAFEAVFDELTNDFVDNAAAKTDDFNSNATSKTGDFNDNATAKTTAFDAHVDSEFDDLTGNFYTKAQVDAKIASTYHYKGSVTDYTELPSSGQQVGDVYNIETAGGGYNAGDNVAWTGSAWDKLAGTVDLSNYYTKSETNTLLDTKQGTIDSSHKVDADLIDDTTSTNKFTTSSDISKLAGIESGAEVNIIETVKVDGTALEVTDKAVDIVGLAAMQSELDDLYAQIPTATATGNPINVQDSSNLPIKDFALGGNAIQQTYTGKNLFDKNNYNAFNGYLETSTSKVVSADGNNIVYIPCKKNTNYTVSKVVTKRFGVGCTVDVPANNVAVSQLSNNYTATSITITTTAEANYLVAWIRNANISGEVSLENVLNSLQIEEGSSATTYEPYTGGTASPNPDYPQDIHVVTGDNTVTVAGKNLLNAPYYVESYSNQYLTFDSTIFKLKSEKDTHYLNLYKWTSDNPFKLKSGTTITYSVNYVSGTLTAGVVKLAIKLVYADGTTKDLTTGDKGTSNYKTQYTTTFTLPQDMVAIRYLVQGYTATVTEELVYTAQLEINNSVTTYQPHTEQTQLLSLGQIELCKIGDYTDKLFKAVQGNTIYDSLDSTTKASLTVGKWYKQEYFTKVILDGTNVGFAQKSSSAANVVWMTATDYSMFEKYGRIKSNYFNEYNSDWLFYHNETGIYVENSRIKCGFTLETTLTTQDLANAWLTTHNVVAYCQRTTPTYTEITDTTLLGQLEELLKKHTNKNVTNISIVPTGTNAEPTAEVEYRQDLQTLTDRITSLEARVSLIE